MSEPTYRVDPHETLQTLLGLSDAEWEQFTVACRRQGTWPLSEAHSLIRNFSETHAADTQTQTECNRCKGFGFVRDPLYKDPIECGKCGGTGSVAA